MSRLLSSRDLAPESSRKHGARPWGLWAATAIVALVTVAAIFGDWITMHDPIAHGNLLESRYLSPSLQHLFGTDKFGRDIFARVIYGGRVSLTIAFSVVCLSFSIGIFYGGFSGYLGGRVDKVMMRLLDFVLAFPLVFLVIAAAALFNVNNWSLILLLSLTSWMEIARVLRGEVLAIREMEYVRAARGMGLSHFQVLFRHVLPNAIQPLLVLIPFKIGEIVLMESALSFLGIGVQPPTPTWGNIINDGRDSLMLAWWISTIPGCLIALLVMSFNIIGEALQKKWRLD